MGDGRGVHVRQARARQARLQGLEPVARDIEGVQTPRAAHRSTNGQGLAACACTEIDHHFAALGIEHQRQQLRAFVLHLDGTARESVHPGQRRLALHTQAPGRVRCGFGDDAGIGQFLCTSARLAFSALTRRSSGAACSMLWAKAQKSSPSCCCSGATSHSGRLWRCGSISSSGRTASQASSHCSSCGDSAARTKLRASLTPCSVLPATRASASWLWAKPKMASLRSREPLPERARLSKAASCAARCRRSRPAQRSRGPRLRFSRKA